MQTGNNYFQKQANMALVMENIYKHKEISRAGLSRELGLIRSTVSNLVQELLNLDVIEELSYSESSSKGGRKAILLGVKKNAGIVVGVEMSGKNFQYSFVNIRGEVVFKKCVEFSADPGEAGFIMYFKTIISEVEKQSKKKGLSVIGMSLGIPGIVDSFRGVIISSEQLKLDGFNFKEKLSVLVNYPVLIENDARSCAWGELWLNPNRKCFYYLLLRKRDFSKSQGIGLGIGVVVDGKVHHGANFLSGEFSHAYHREINDRYREMFSEIFNSSNITVDKLREKYLDVVHDFLNMVSIMDPEIIYAGAELADFTDTIDKLFSINNSLEPEYQKSWKISASTLGEFEVSLGAAFIFLKKLYSIPQVGQKDEYSEISWDSIFSQL